MVTFFSPVSRGSAPRSNWRARALAMTTNSNRLSLGVRCTGSSMRRVRRTRSATSPGPKGPGLQLRRVRKNPAYTLFFGAGLRKRGDDRFRLRPHPSDPRPFREHDAAQALDRQVQRVVDDDVVVARELADLVAGGVEPPPYLLVRVLAAAAQTLLEDLGRRRQHEDAHRLHASRPHLPCPLAVDHQHHVLAVRNDRVD